MARSGWADMGDPTRPLRPRGASAKAPRCCRCRRPRACSASAHPRCAPGPPPGACPHVRTPGGHRRFELDELVRWLAERGGAPPAPVPQRLQELVPTRVEAMPGPLARWPTPRAPEARRDVRGGAGAEPGVRRGTAARRPPASPRARRRWRRWRTPSTPGTSADCYREAEWEGFRHGASGQPGDAVVTEALAAAPRRRPRARPDPAPGARWTSARWSARSTGWPCAWPSGYADGVRCRLRSAASDVRVP